MNEEPYKICLRLNTDEAQKLITNAKACGLTRTAYLSLANTTLMAARTADTTRVLTFLSECACVRATAADWFLDIKIASESK